LNRLIYGPSRVASSNCALTSAITPFGADTSDLLAGGGVTYSNAANQMVKSDVNANVVNASREFFDVNTVKFPDLLKQTGSHERRRCYENPNGRSPDIHQFNFGIQRELPRDALSDIAMSEIKGRNCRASEISMHR
jgi:hypothetical protein